MGDKGYTLFAGDGFITCLWEKHGSPREVVDLGEIYWIVIKPEYFNKDGKFEPGKMVRIKTCR